jgi:hypothetical protein
MRVGAIVGSALAGAAAGAVLTMNRRDKNQITNFFSGLSGNVSDYVTQFSGKLDEWKDLIPGLKTVEDHVPATTGKSKSKGARA